jgi:hypothetical protein
MKNREPIYGQTGGCWVGENSWLAEQWTWPFAGIYIYRDELVLSMSFRRYTFRREDIVRIYENSRGFTTGLRIEHTAADVPAYIVFCPIDLEECEEALDANAFPIERP